MSKKILKFSADWCKNCKPLTKLIENAEVSIPVQEYDIDWDYDIATRYNIKGVPTLVLLDAVGDEIARHTGLLTKDQLLKFCEK